MLEIDLLRLIIGATVLGYACYTDLKTRMAPNILWIIMGGAGVILLIVQYLTGNIQNWIYLVFIPIIIGLVYVLFYVGLIFGGADAKAIMALAILNPFWPSVFNFPLHTSLMPFSWTIFSNSIIIFLLMPPSFLVYNALKREVELPYALIGYKMDIEEAKKKFVWPLEKIVDGKRKMVFMPEDFDTSEHLRELENAGLKRIWVTPKVPFMIPLLIGYIVAYTYGDIIFSLINFAA
ncbi:MAG TPA: A24 family peptidase [Thermoplasmatales archaeon]|nr:A24 family peptidase [Thermoplasmatales archaeon]